MQASTELIQRLMEIGYAAAGGELFAEALTVFDGVRAVRPESEFPLIGRAVTEMNDGRHGEAVKTLEAALRANPQSPLTKSFRGLALKLSGMAQESQRVLEEVVAAGGDENAVAMARSILETG